jgi:tRNA threonylcarbamoyladenosine biosynthesis protein TsaB
LGDERLKSKCFLAIEAATPACSLAIYNSGRIQQRYRFAPRQHQQIFPEMLTALLAEMRIALSDIEYIACGVGPGSFSGTRMAAAFALGLAYGLDCKILAVSTLSALAYSLPAGISANHILVAMDARMGQWYWNSMRLNENGLWQAEAEDQCSDPGKCSFLKSKPDSYVVLGDAFLTPAKEWPVWMQAQPPAAILPRVYPQAWGVLQCALECDENQAQDPIAFTPIYLRDAVNN